MNLPHEVPAKSSKTKAKAKTTNRFNGVFKTIPMDEEFDEVQQYSPEKAGLIDGYVQFQNKFPFAKPKTDPAYKPSFEKLPENSMLDAVSTSNFKEKAVNYVGIEFGDGDFKVHIWFP